MNNTMRLTKRDSVVYVPLVELRTKPLATEEAEKSGIPADKKLSLGVKAVSFFRYTAHAICALVKAPNRKPLEPLKLLFYVNIPVALNNIFNQLGSVRGLTANEKIDTALDVTSEVGRVGDSLATGIEGLGSVGLVNLQPLYWVSPLFIVGVGLQIAGILALSKSLVETHLFSRKFSKVVDLTKKGSDYSVADFTLGLEMVQNRSRKEKSFVLKHFGVDSKKLLGPLYKIKKLAENSFFHSSAKVGESEDKMKAAMELLSKRLTATKWSKALTILIGTVTLIGVGVLLFTPAAPVGFALLAIGSVAAIRYYFAVKAQTAQFEEELRKIAGGHDENMEYQIGKP